MKRFKTTICLLLFISMLLFVRCEREQYHARLTEEQKSWLDFYLGSYWIYQDETTGIIDCVYVSYYQSYIANNVSSADGKTAKYGDEQMIAMDFKHDNGNTTIYTNIMAYDDNGLRYSWEEKNSLLKITCAIKFYFDEPIKIISGSDNSLIRNTNLIINRYNEFPVAGKSYLNVFHIKSLESILYSNRFEEFIDNEYWLAKNVGFIRKKINTVYNNRVWNLIRYRVVKLTESGTLKFYSWGVY